MTEEKKSQIRKRITFLEILLAAVLLLYLVYGMVTKNSSQMIFNVLAVLVITVYVILNDFAEPYFTGVFTTMNEFGKEAYKKYLLWDIASMAGLLFFVLTFTEEGSIMTYLGLVVYFIGTKQKRPYQSAYLGDVTEEDVEAAKLSAPENETEDTEE